MGPSTLPPVASGRNVLRRTKALEAGTIPHGRAPVLAVILDHANSLALGADAKPQ